jgi:hypothetical protein
VYVRAFPEPGGKSPVSTGGGRFPIWSRNGRNLFFLTPDWRLMIVDYTVTGDSFTASKPKVWSDKSLAFLGGNYPYDVSADGKRFAVVQYGAGIADQEQRSNDNVIVLLNFFDELRQRVR